MRKCLFCMMVMLYVWGSGVVWADQLEELQNKVETQSKQINLLKHDIHLLRSSQKLQERLMSQKIETSIRPVEARADELPKALKWLERTDLSADFRYRIESINDDRKAGYGAKPRNRNRIRMRVKVHTQLNNDWALTSRFATSSGNPRSTNVTLEDGFSGKDFRLDQAFFTYAPEQAQGFEVGAGKLANPFHRVGGNQMIWDNDVNPEGLVSTYSLSLGGDTSMDMGVGGFWVEERSAGVDSGLFACQGLLRQTMGGQSLFIIGTSYYDYSNIRKRPALATTWDSTVSASAFFGNSNDGANRYANDYDLWEVFTEYQSEIEEMPFSVFGSWVQNVGMDPGYTEDTGWLAGLRLNKAKEPGSWQFSYHYRDVEADAVLAQFTDSDFLSGDTGGRGHVFSVALQATEFIRTEFNVFDNRSGVGPIYYDRVQLDLIIKSK